MALSFVDYLAYIMVGFKGLLFLVAGIFLVSGIDDLVVDVIYFTRSIYRALFVWKRHRRMTEQELLAVPEQPIAVMVPAWNESAIIFSMVNNTIATLNYSNFHVFIGTYPNDLDTQREVARLRELHDNIHCIVCRDPGPTSKADCLNWVYWGIKDFEKANGFEFPIFVMEDAEDIIHPLALKLMNYLIPRKNMVQLPVVPFEPAHWYQLTRAHYMDEFAENHHKNMVIREVFGRGIPCAGVGCGFSREALEILSSDNEQHMVFKLGSLTEDYEMGMRLKAVGVERAIFVKFPIRRTVPRKSRLTGKTRQVEKDELVSIRNVFPATMKAAVRQKSRWIAGIALQGWENLRWEGDFLTKYVLFKDRKALLTSQVNMLGYLVILFVLGYYLVVWLHPDAYRYPPLVEQGSLLWHIIQVTTIFLFLRLAVRMYCVYRFYDLKRALLSVVNFVWANFVNFFATNRALFLFYQYLVTGKWIKWDHTQHAPPSEEELSAFRRRIGDMLVERRLINFTQLEEAIAEQKRSGRLLGDILMQKGLVSEDELVQTLGMQLRITTREIDPYQTPLELLRLLPRELAVRYSVFPVELKENRLILAAAALPHRDELSAIEQAVAMPVELCLTAKSSLSFSIQRGYERLEQGESDRPKLGELLLEKNLVTPETLREALKRQRKSYARLGDILLDEGMITVHELNSAFDQQVQNPGERLGEFLVRQGFLTDQQLERATKLQKTRFRALGDILSEMGAVTQETVTALLHEINQRRRRA
ncbi:glycosyl transferase family protein [Geomesophilobacter sediminis]|uniref:Phage adsorption protein NrfB n=1 Tax=Geomesophilobacter sediminis TaxID=2798584 RepID=A0A8J7M2F6_9BACT|nr:glycosyl transferase family protein [Geomesophilobacter sediminis]MBJ6727407.1 phage adsorption protein NrfB [Geomesophilobacter sediminis]